MTSEIPAIPIGAQGALTLAPTDVAQFIRLGQCRRYLRLHLHRHMMGSRFLKENGVTEQPIPPLLAESGRGFELAIERDIRARFPVVRCSEDERDEIARNDNAIVIARARELPRGDTLIILQPRVEATIGLWRLRGDLDLLRLERDAEGRLHILIVDIKSTTAAKVEHRLQVAFYYRMIAAILADAGIAHEPIGLAILYRGPAPTTTDDPLSALSEEQLAQRRDAEETFAITTSALLERIDDTAGGIAAYLGAVDDLVLNEDSVARQVVATPFADIPFHLGTICDGCSYNAFCMKQCAASDDLSLIPHMTALEKSALREAKITTVRQLARLKDLAPPERVTVEDGEQPYRGLVTRPETKALTQRLATTWPLGPSLDELIHRARRYRTWVGDSLESVSYIPYTGYTSLPAVDAEHHPNMVRIYLDAQHDHLNDRVAMLGALVVGAEQGEVPTWRRRTVVRLANRQPHELAVERDLLIDWVKVVLEAVVNVAAAQPNSQGEASAPIHLIFFNAYAQQVLLEALGRHATDVLGATALYDFVTQVAAYDSPVVSYLDREIKTRKNYPMVCQPLQSVAAMLRFDWEPYNEIFRERLFDYRNQLDGEELAEGDARQHTWYTSRARFDSQIPLEYLHAAWGELPAPKPGRPDTFRGYRHVSRTQLTDFFARRLEAMEHIAQEFPGNRKTTHTPFALPNLQIFENKAETLAEALDEFLTIERHVELAAWKTARYRPPEQRVLDGEALVVSYHAADQDPDMRARYEEFERRRLLDERYRQAFAAAHPGEKVVLTKEQKAETKRDPEGIVLRLRLTTDGIAGELDEIVTLVMPKAGERFVLAPRTEADSRPEMRGETYTPTAKALLYRMRVQFRRLEVTQDAAGRVTDALVEIGLLGQFGGKPDPVLDRGHVFNGHIVGLSEGERYSLDPDPNDFYGGWLVRVTVGLMNGGANAVYAHLAGEADTLSAVAWPEVANAAQARFLEGLDALHAAGVLHAFDRNQRAYIGEHGGDPLLLVQGPPGTGKSYSTALAIFARMQGAMAAGRDCRVLVSCKTHSATNVLLVNVLEAQERLQRIAQGHPAIWQAYFDDRLLTVPIFRHAPREEEAALPEAIVPLAKKGSTAWKRIDTSRWSVLGATPGGIYRFVSEKFNSKDLFGHELFDIAVLDEASQMNIPEAVLATLAVRLDGRIIVVGDHRQMPPIVKNDWSREVRRSFQQFRAFDSLFLALLAVDPPIVRFAQSFRLHADMAEFLRQEIYRHDGIPYFSRKRDALPRPKYPETDAFVRAALDPEHPLTVIVHDEESSQRRNVFEQRLIAPIMAELAATDRYALDAREGLGVVVPHRAQRAALQEAIPALTIRDAVTGEVQLTAVDTVEKFQGDERRVIVIGTTESDPGYLLENGDFLLDPRRLTVALSRAKEKLILVASRSVFEIFSADEETFANAQLWKNLLRETCTMLVWSGERDGHRVDVWGNM